MLPIIVFQLERSNNKIPVSFICRNIFWIKLLKVSESSAMSRSRSLLCLKAFRTVLTLGLNRVHSIRKIDWRPPEYKLCRIFGFILFVHQMVVVLMKNISKYIKSFVFAFWEDAWFLLNV